MALPSLSSKIPGETASFGKVAVKLGFITASQLEEAIKVQSSASKAGLRKKLGEILIKKGYLTPEQFEQVMRSQTVERKRIGAYELISKLGEGGMGSVFKARQVFMDRVIALKILSSKMAKNKDFRERFLREARAVAKLNHPHIVAGIDVGSADGYCYFAMEYVDGESLGQYMQRKGGRLEERTALEFARQTALALHHAHQNNLLHRDVKPDNLLLDINHKTVKLADLGLARSTDGRAEDASLARSGQAVGTPFYISPEQARGLIDLTPATDIYSLGATMFHMLTGQVPFDGPSAEVIMTRQVTDQVPSLCGINPNVSPAAEKIVQKCMQKSPENRYQSAQAVAIDIEHLFSSSPSAKNISVAESPVVPVQQRQSKSDRLPLQEGPVAKDTPDMHPITRAGTASLRPVRRRSSGSDFFGFTSLLIFLVCLAVLYFFYRRIDMEPKLPPSRPAHADKQASAPVSPAAPVLIQPTAVPAAIKPDANGGFVFKDDFEADTNLPCYEADLLMAPQEPVRRIEDGTHTNHVLRLARVIDKDAACMGRLLLPVDIDWSPTATVSFMVWAGAHSANAAAPEVQVCWDHRPRGSKQRFLAKWSFKNLDFKDGWRKIELQLNSKLDSFRSSRQLADKPQFIAILAGRQGEDIEVFIDNLTVTNPGTEDASTPAVPAKEQPVAPPPSAN